MIKILRSKKWWKKWEEEEVGVFGENDKGVAFYRTLEWTRVIVFLCPATSPSPSFFVPPHQNSLWITLKLSPPYNIQSLFETEIEYSLIIKILRSVKICLNSSTSQSSHSDCFLVAHPVFYSKIWVQCDKTELHSLKALKPSLTQTKSEVLRTSWKYIQLPFWSPTSMVHNVFDLCS